ncbi:uncharacterized protein LOC126474458 [Schistocerca serialis cubense]|uniref:uncharacterized protein LOC126474458 n=1 Tax=Schistocerca serialis cubense TaxID=2023355 RepID=UPI00214F3A3B|nr:uncharacterized protein LOC126474458 [Schistocerca serialis cubense]
MKSLQGDVPDKTSGLHQFRSPLPAVDTAELAVGATSSTAAAVTVVAAAGAASPAVATPLATRTITDAASNAAHDVAVDAATDADALSADTSRQPHIRSVLPRGAVGWVRWQSLRSVGARMEMSDRYELHGSPTQDVKVEQWFQLPKPRPFMLWWFVSVVCCWGGFPVRNTECFCC